MIIIMFQKIHWNWLKFVSLQLKCLFLFVAETQLKPLWKRTEWFSACIVDIPCIKDLKMFQMPQTFFYYTLTSNDKNGYLMMV